VQFHPEFQSKPLQPHPLFTAFVAAALRGGKPVKAVVKTKAKKAKPVSKQSRKGAEKAKKA
jgi:CTP synthase